MAVPDDAVVSHGICRDCLREAHILPRLRSLRARLAAVDHDLDAAEREQMAAQLGRLIGMLEREPENRCGERPGERA